MSMIGFLVVCFLIWLKSGERPWSKVSPGLQNMGIFFISLGILSTYFFTFLKIISQIIKNLKKLYSKKVNGDETKKKVKLEDELTIEKRDLIFYQANDPDALVELNQKKIRFERRMTGKELSKILSQDDGLKGNKMVDSGNCIEDEQMPQRENHLNCKGRKGLEFELQIIPKRNLKVVQRNSEGIPGESSNAIKYKLSRNNYNKKEEGSKSKQNSNTALKEKVNPRKSIQTRSIVESHLVNASWANMDSGANQLQDSRRSESKEARRKRKRRGFIWNSLFLKAKARRRRNRRRVQAKDLKGDNNQQRIWMSSFQSSGLPSQKDDCCGERI